MTKSRRLPASAKVTSASPRVTHVQRMAARLDPSLDQPYFKSKPTSHACMHSQFGVTLDKQAQRAYCNRCGEEIALFDALWNYHHAEERLVSTLHSLDEYDKREAAKKQRDKERRPFMRAVKGFKCIRDMTLKTEPVVARDYELECGHRRKMDGDRSFEKVHCHQCQQAAATQQVKPK